MLGLPGDILGRIFVENLLTQHLPGHGKQTARPGDVGVTLRASTGSLLVILLGLVLMLALVPVVRACWSSRGSRAAEAARGRSGAP